MSVYYCESCQSEQNEYINTGSLPVVLPGQPNIGFNIGTGFNGTIFSIQIQSDGKILVGGEFESYSGVSYSRIIRLNTDGSIDNSFVIGTGFGGTIYSIKIQSDGKILVGGNFIEYNGTSVGSFVRLESDGTIDITFDVGTGFFDASSFGPGFIQAIQIQSDGKILVGGYFDEYNGTSIGSSLIRLESDGTIDTTFDVGTGFFISSPDSSGIINSIQIQSDGKILVGGIFDEYSGTSVGSGLIRLELDGTIDTTLDVGSGFNNGSNLGSINYVQIQSDGKILVGGIFDEYSGTSVGSGLIRLELDGTIDTTLDVGDGFFGTIYSIQIQSDGKILVGGGFIQYNGTSVGSFVRLESDGTIDITFDVGTGFDDVVFSIQIQSDGNILVGGSFNFYNGFSSPYICKIEQNVNPTTIYAANFECYTPLVKVSGNISPLFSVGNGFSDPVNTITLQADGKILVGGQFISYSGVSYNRIIRLNTDYTIDNSFVIGSGFENVNETFSYTIQIYTIQIQSDGKILVGGQFSSYSGVSSNNIIRLNTDGSIDNSFVIGAGITFNTSFTNGNVNKIQIKSDGKILVGGNFDRYNGEYYKNVVSLNNDGSVDETFYIKYGFNNVVTDISLQPDGKILFVGAFTQWNGYDAGDENTIFEPSTIPSQVNTSLKDINNDILFGFGSGIRKVDSISGITIFSAETDSVVNSLEELSDSSILVAGGFTTYSGITTYGLTKINSLGYEDSSFDVGFGFPGNILTTKELPNGKILVGGNFTKYGLEQVFISFNLGIVGSNTPGVRSMVEQPDGKFIIAGQFTSYGGSGNNKIVRLNTDGSKDNTFFIGSGFGGTSNSISQIYLQPDFKVLCVGSFVTYQGITRNRIIRLNTNGSEDSSFIIGTGFNGTTNTIALQSDGKILVGGGFTSYSGVSRNRIIRLNTDGSVDTSFVIGTGFGSIVAVTTLQSDGKILVGGSFTTYSGLTRNRIIRLNTDGSTDTSFVIGTGFDNSVITIASQSDGKILVGGSFTLYSGVSRNSIIRLNTNGSVDTGFVIGTGFNGTVSNITLRSDGKILVGGDFTSYSGVSINRSILLNTDGSIDLSFSMTGSTGAANNTVFGFLPKSSFTFVFGNFTTYNGISQTYLTKISYTYAGLGTPFGRYSRLNSNGSLDLTFSAGTGFTSTVNKIDTQSDGKILVAGAFTQYSGIPTNKIVRLNTDNTLDTTFDTTNVFNGDINNFDFQSDGKIIVGGSFTALQNPTNTVSTFNGNVNNSITQPDGKILVGGGFSSYSGVTRLNIIRLNTDYTIDGSFIIGNGFNTTVRTIILQSDGKILVGGDFTTYSGVSYNRIIRLNTNGSIDNSFVIGSGFNTNYVDSIQLQPDGKILVGGSFASYSGVSSNNIIRLNTDGSVDPSFVIGTGFSGGGGNVNSITLQSDGKILVGGAFTTYSGLTRNRIIRLNTDGSTDTSFVIGTGFDSTVQTISLQSDGKILVGGDFISYSGVSGNRIIRLNTDGSVDTSFVIGTGFNNQVSSIESQSDGKILVGGSFSSYSGVSSVRIIRLNTNGSVDNSFFIGTGFNGVVNTITLQPDGKILVGGSIISYNDVTIGRFAVILTNGNLNGSTYCKRIARLNTDGTFDNTFVSSNSFNGTVTDVSILPNGEILTSGGFTAYGTTTSNRFARLNSDGSYDPTFIVDPGFGSSAFTITQISNDYVLVGGNFTSYDSFSAPRLVQLYLQSEPITYSNRIIRLNPDGTNDTTFNVGSGFNNNPYSIELQLDGKILVGGQFTLYSGISKNGIIRLNTDGSVDTSFVIGTGFTSSFGSSSGAITIQVQSDGKILAGGGFTSYNGELLNKMVRLTPDGSIDDTFDIGSGFDNAVNVIQLQSEDRILVGGNFNSVDDFFAPRFTSLVTNQPNVEIQGSLLFDNCEICNSFILSSNTEYVDCLICNGDALLVDAPHPIWSNNYGRAVTQLDAVTIGGNGWNS
jgi:uncharacterized delta-60 repeat protein